MRLLPLALVIWAMALVVQPDRADASRYVRFGVQDDAWLTAGPGRMEDRLAELDRLNVEVYRYTLRWDQVARTKPADGRDPADPAYDWSAADAVIDGLSAHGITPLVTIWGTPRWANGGRSANWVPLSKWWLASFAHAAATRYRADARRWTIWNEPNKRRWFRPVSARLYTTLLNAAYGGIKSADRRAVVAGGVTAPRGGSGGISPVDFIRRLGRHHARLDAYAHNPYPLQPKQTPSSGGCGHCKTITMASLERLVREVRQAFGNKRIWLTDYGYQTNPPDRLLGVSYGKQVDYQSQAARRVVAAPLVDLLIHFMVQDDGTAAGWQSGFRTPSGAKKPSYSTWSLPLTQVSRRGLHTVVWGQVRDRSGRGSYRLQQRRTGAWHWVGAKASTDARGFYRRVVRAAAGSQLRVFSFDDRTYSRIVTVR